jgi:subtilisin family serine protease
LSCEEGTMKGDYIVLRDANQTLTKGFDIRSFGAATEDTSGGAASFSSSGPLGPPAPSIEVHRNIDPHDIAELTQDPHSLVVAPSMPVSLIEPTETPESDATDPGPGPTWGITAIGADKCPFNGQSATVAVIDSGIRQDHKAFPAGSLKIVGKDFTGLGDFADQNGHGTHCAATILGRDVSGRRIGVAPGVQTLLVARIFGPGVTTTSQMIAQALQWSMDNGANVISMSLGFDFTGFAAQLQQSGLPPQAATAQALLGFQSNLRLFDALMNTFRAQEEGFPDTTKGAVIVGAAGNHSQRKPAAGQPSYTVPVEAPSNALSLISVGALQPGPLFDIAPFSNSAPKVVAPGVGILSADFSGADLLTLKSGTSMACPHVAGLAALWWDSVNSGGLPRRANTVSTLLQTSCVLSPLLPALGVADRGTGLPQAPKS